MIVFYGHHKLNLFIVCLSLSFGPIHGTIYSPYTDLGSCGIVLYESDHT